MHDVIMSMDVQKWEQIALGQRDNFAMFGKLVKYPLVRLPSCTYVWVHMQFKLPCDVHGTFYPNKQRLNVGKSSEKEN